MPEKKYLITGSMGCLGAWTLYHLVKRGERAISFDISEDRSRLNLLLKPAEQAAIHFLRGDLTDKEQVAAAIRENHITHIIHLAALQVPFCRANPVLGAQVNVVGTLNIFEGAKAAGIGHVVYASSIAVYGAAQDYPPGLIQADAPLKPLTLYGAFKQCNEQNARTYWQEHGLSSAALRPYIVYGPGRDQGLTSDPTRAMLAAVQGQPFQIGFGGSGQYQLASDVAQQFIEAADAAREGAHVFNLGGPLIPMEDIAAAIREVIPGAEISFEPNLLPFPAGFDGSELRLAASTVYETPLIEGVKQTIDCFRANLGVQ